MADDYHLRAISLKTLRDHEPEDNIPPGWMVLKLVPELPVEEYHVQRIHESDLIIPLTRDNADPFDAGTPTGRIVSRKSIDYEYFRKCIEWCSSEHAYAGLCEQRSYGIKPRMKVIHCSTGNVIDLVKGDYVALSYCIGPRTSNATRRKHYPQVVADAMTCTLALGYEYLWVDQHCIDQDDKAELAAAIAQMDQIYSQAVLTIVSLGESQDHGLPGVSRPRSCLQAHLSVGEKSYVSTISSLLVSIARSRWNSRGWCFQETVLSTRMLILAADQAHFLCGLGVKSEAFNDALEELNHGLSGLRLPGYLESTAKKDETTRTIWWEFGDWITSYARKDLSFESDVLNAMRGVLNLARYYSWWGIPFVDDGQGDDWVDTRAFAAGLAWCTLYNGDADLYGRKKGEQVPSAAAGPCPYRRSGFPSWSWTSCKPFNTPISYLVPGGFAVEHEDELCTIKPCADLTMQVEGPDGSLVSVTSLMGDFRTQRGDEGSKCIPEAASSIYIQTQTFVTTVKPVRDFDDLDRSDLWRQQFCLAYPHEQFQTSLADSPNETTSHVRLVEGSWEIEDGRFPIDFDVPATTEDAYDLVVVRKAYLALTLFQRQVPDLEATDEQNEVTAFVGAEWCVLLLEPADERADPAKVYSTNEVEQATVFKRVGLVWVEDEHLCQFEHNLRSIRLV